MHTIWTRISNGSAMLSSFVMGLLALITMTTFVFTADPKGHLSISSIKVKQTKLTKYSIKTRETATVNFNATADLKSLFNWNTKQLFLYLEAEYTDAQGVKNEVVFWDRIVRRKQDAFIKVVGKNKYHLRDLTPSFKNASAAEYALKYNVMPYVGVLTYGEIARTGPMTFPEA